MAALLLGPYYPAKINNDKFMKTKQCMGGRVTEFLLCVLLYSVPKSIMILIDVGK